MRILIETVNKVHRQLTFFVQLHIVKFYPLLFVYSYLFLFSFLFFSNANSRRIENKERTFFMVDVLRNKSLKVLRTFFLCGVVWCVCDSESKTINSESAIQTKGMVDNLNNRQISGSTFFVVRLLARRSIVYLI